MNSRITQQILIAIAIGLVLACVIAGAGIVAQNALRIASAPTLTPTPKPTASRTATRAATSIPTTTFTPAITQTPTASPTPAPTLGPTRTPKPAVQHLFIDRPVAIAAIGNSPSRNYLFGTTRSGELDVHHGEEFENATGTPVFSVADGTVVVAGNDEQPLCGDNSRSPCGRNLQPDGFYGNLIVIQLARTYRNQRIFALYGHLNAIDVTVGRNLIVGDVLGEIGQTGIALGPHVHFEVRVGVNDYAHTRNPILWMIPLAGRGALAGRYADAKNVLVQGAPIKIYRDDGTYVGETETYSRDKFAAVVSDDEMGENFAFPDLPAGDYVIKVDGTQFAAKATIEEGKLTFVDLGGM
ncbi:MAG: peptidoglycan DD-metalloendopeptidase family protein [Chloroflexi bacterium]|nr:peptidoglycan DD-metalloendopeptidase family protein [Chloroflexota bacterium]